MDRKATGRYGEDEAVEILRRKGYLIRDRNYHTKYGELDVVAEDGTFLVFVEVKARKSSCHHTGLEAITRTKRMHLTKAAALYLARHRLQDRPCRFDVMAVYTNAGGEVEGYLHIPGAFQVEGGRVYSC
ncbi:MAG TPA: YraN family protein [Firmicutes bacterium]|jgi:putative endonuclease|nr:YraN family protein [Bacillota bacterium]HOQ23063.1 YraN family protein [Bacillota bacterium]HPT66961.1 YraN family protein [Bacillota bacterium]